MFVGITSHLRPFLQVYNFHMMKDLPVTVDKIDNFWLKMRSFFLLPSEIKCLFILVCKSTTVIIVKCICALLDWKA